MPAAEIALSPSLALSEPKMSVAMWLVLVPMEPPAVLSARLLPVITGAVALAAL